MLHRHAPFNCCEGCCTCNLQADIRTWLREMAAKKAGRRRRLLVACVQRLEWARVASLWSIDLDVSQLIAQHMPTESFWELSRTTSTRRDNEAGAGGVWACGTWGVTHPREVGCTSRVEAADFGTRPHPPHELGGAVGMMEGEELGILKANMLASTAGFAAVTWALGIGDRHDDNVVLSSDGVVLCGGECGRSAFGSFRWGITRLSTQ